MMSSDAIILFNSLASGESSCKGGSMNNVS